MRLITRLGGMAAAALLLAAAPPAPAQELDDIAGHIAAQSAALGPVLDRLSKPEVARAVVDSAVRGDLRTFEGLFEGVEVKVPNKCVLIAETVEKLTSTFVGLEPKCHLRDNLTASEWMEYVLITLRYYPLTDVNSPPALDAVIPPGDYLEELKAHGLVICPPGSKYHSGIFLFPGKPERFCLGKP
jgi:hypothetical protein